MSSRLSVERIREEQWVARYVAGRLSETELDAFEEYCIGHPAMVDEVALEKRMKSALAKTVAKSPAQFRETQRAGRWMLPIAAGVLIAVIGGVLLMYGRPLDLSKLDVLASTSQLRQQLPSLPAVSLAQTRGSQLQNLGAASREVVRVKLSGSFDQSGSYDISLVSADDDGARVIATLDRQPATSQSELNLVMNGARIPQGLFTLRVVNVATGDVLEYDFRKD
jgi:hypothetical protein